MRQKNFKAGTVIFEEGEASADAFIICDGHVEILKNSATGMVRLAVLGERDVFGEMGLLDECPRSATARAYDDVVLIAMNRTEFLHVFTSKPEHGLTLLRALFERLRTMDRRLVEETGGTGLDARLPEVVLLPDSESAARCLPQDGLKVSRFPFRIGRRSDPHEEPFACNELELPDTAPPTVSLNHLAIDLGYDGVVVRDRGSTYGAILNGKPVAGRTGADSGRLQVGENALILGTGEHSSGDPPYRFRVVVR